MVRINGMAQDIFWPSRRAVLAGLGASTMVAAAPAAEELSLPGASGQTRFAGRARRGGRYTGIRSLGGADLLFKQGERAELPLPTNSPTDRPQLAGIGRSRRSRTVDLALPGVQGASESLHLPLRHAGPRFGVT